MTRTYVKDLVSVIMPIYNTEKFLEEALNSIFEQSYKNIEIVLVDDCSKDRSADIISALMKTHPEIVYHIQEKNMGAGVARNKSLELAKGQYVAFLDSDDAWKKDKIERQLSLMKKKKSPFSYTAIEIMDCKSHTIKGKRNIAEICDYKYLLHNTIIATSSVVVDRSALGDFRMSLRRGGQDYATWLSLLRSGTVACGINESLVRYRVTSGSLSSNKFKSIRQVWEIQTQNENIPKLNVVFNIICFSLNALKKYLL